MHIFNRRTVAALGKQLEATASAVEIAAKVAQISGREISVFSARFGAPLGSIMWSTRVDSMADVQAMTDKLMADGSYLDDVAAMNGLFMTPAEDGLSRVITDPIDGPPAKYYGVTRASMVGGKFNQAMEFGVGVSQYMASALGTDVSFVKAGYGGFADVAWLTAFNTIAEIDAFDDWQLSDAGYHEWVTKAGELFIDNSGHTSLIEKLN